MFFQFSSSSFTCYDKYNKSYLFMSAQQVTTERRGKHTFIMLQVLCISISVMILLGPHLGSHKDIIGVSTSEDLIWNFDRLKIHLRVNSIWEHKDCYTHNTQQFNSSSQDSFSHFLQCFSSFKFQHEGWETREIAFLKPIFLKNYEQSIHTTRFFFFGRRLVKRNTLYCLSLRLRHSSLIHMDVLEQ